MLKVLADKVLADKVLVDKVRVDKVLVEKVRVDKVRVDACVSASTRTKHSPARSCSLEDCSTFLFIQLHGAARKGSKV